MMANKVQTDFIFFWEKGGKHQFIDNRWKC